MATKEVQVHQRTQSGLIDEKEDGILEKRNEKRNCQPVAAGGFGLVALLDSWDLSCWGSGVGSVCSTEPWLGALHHFGFHRALPSLQHPEQPHCRLRRSQKALNWSLACRELLLSSGPYLGFDDFGFATGPSPQLCYGGVNEMALRPGIKIIKLAVSSF